MNEREKTEESAENHRISLFDALRTGIAFLILYSAVTKGWELSTVPVLGSGFLYSRWFNALIVIGESGFGLLMLTKFLSHLKWLAMLLLFIIFALVSTYEWLLGAKNCTCFGSSSGIHPLVTATIDSVIAIALYKIRPIEQEMIYPKLRTLFILGVGWILAVSVFLSGFFSVEKKAISSLGTEFIGIDGQRTISLLPEMWNESLPILGFLEPIEIRGQLQEGEWTVVFYHHDCPQCRQSIINLAVNGTTSVVCIEIPPYGRNDYIPDSFIKARLSNQWGWSIKTPFVIKKRLSYR